MVASQIKKKWLYEKDSRDNIEGNLRFPFMADQRFREIKDVLPVRR